ncbi:hypothetical protein Ferp_0910 [Ferroglobus placidus DSM 10642]|uniref:Uncharacterized protein n=1 Tax=Ferroglobus placidus (strain DSM 10642 / AEDII12DO) TaxID=589924 RepID=D3RX63_FERPA|nr:hypothetical protein Ferp_0910 [Ferroglobus placidus DSM 10642]
MDKKFDLDEFDILFLISMLLVVIVFAILIFKYGF